MICAIHQPNYIPYLGFFHKFKRSDAFVLYDTAQYSKNDFHNRNKIMTPAGPQWLTIPVSIHLGDLIKDAKVTNRDFVKKHLGLLEQNYKKTAHFEAVFPELEKIYLQFKSDFLMDINLPLLLFLFDKIGPGVKVVLSSELDLDPAKRSTEALIEICNKVQADTYLSGQGAKAYLDEEAFGRQGLAVEWQDFHHPEYPQPGGEFAPNLSVVDALFNLGFSGLADKI